MKESSEVIKRLYEKGYTLNDISKIIDISAEDLEGFLSSDKKQFEKMCHISNCIKSIKKLVINEAPKIDGDNNILGDHHCKNTDEIIMNLLRLIEEKDVQINKLLDRLNID